MSFILHIYSQILLRISGFYSKSLSWAINRQISRELTNFMVNTQSCRYCDYKLHGESAMISRFHNKYVSFTWSASFTVIMWVFVWSASFTVNCFIENEEASRLHNERAGFTINKPPPTTRARAKTPVTQWGMLRGDKCVQLPYSYSYLPMKCSNISYVKYKCNNRCKILFWGA